MKNCAACSLDHRNNFWCSDSGMVIFFLFARALKFSSGKIQNIPHFWLHTLQKQICCWTKCLCNVLSWELDVFKKLHASHIQNNRTKTPSMSSEINLNQVQASWEEKICSKINWNKNRFFSRKNVFYISSFILMQLVCFKQV